MFFRKILCGWRWVELVESCDQKQYKSKTFNNSTCVGRATKPRLHTILPFRRTEYKIRTEMSVHYNPTSAICYLLKSEPNLSQLLYKRCNIDLETLCVYELFLVVLWTPALKMQPKNLAWQRLWKIFRLAANRRSFWRVTPWTKYAIPVITIMMIVMNDVWRQSQLEIIVVKIMGYSSPRHGSFTDRPTDGRDYSRQDRDQKLSRWERWMIWDLVLDK